MKVHSVWWATARASSVFPVPGGPYSNTPSRSRYIPYSLCNQLQNIVRPSILTAPPSLQPLYPYSPSILTAPLSLQPLYPYSPCILTAPLSLQPLYPYSPSILTAPLSLQPLYLYSPSILTAPLSLQPSSPPPLPRIYFELFFIFSHIFVVPPWKEH